MAWFSPIKGHYPSLGQIDKTLPVAVNNTDIVRGTFLKLTADGEFAIATDASAPLYISLQNYTDAQAGMAGTTRWGNGNAAAYLPETANKSLKVPAGVPAITGLSLTQDGEYQTDQFDAEGVYAIGDKLTVGAGGLLKKASDSDTAVAYVTAVPFKRWVNDAPALGARGERTGALVTVLQFAAL